MLDSLRSPEAQYIKSGHIIVVKFGTVGFIEYIKRRDIQLLEFIVIIILAASAFLAAKKDQINGGEHRKIKAQKVIILATALLITLSILFPPCAKFVSLSKADRMTKHGTGWTWILKTKGRELDRIYKLNGLDAKFLEIRYAILAAEIIGILTLAGAAYLRQHGGRNRSHH